MKNTKSNITLRPPRKRGYNPAMLGDVPRGEQNTIKYSVVDLFGGYEASGFDTYELAHAFIKSLGRKYYYLRVVKSDYIVSNAPANFSTVPTAEQWTPHKHLLHYKWRNQRASITPKTEGNQNEKQHERKIV